jgi:hypothetical protein
MFKAQLVKWEGDPPSYRPTAAVIKARLKDFRLVQYLNPLKWRAIARHLFAKTTPDPVGHPLCTEIMEWTDSTSPTVTYRRP